LGGKSNLSGNAAIRQALTIEYILLREFRIENHKAFLVRIFSYDWSDNCKTLVVIRGAWTADMVLLSQKLDGSEPPVHADSPDSFS